MENKKYQSVDAYINDSPKEVAAILNKIRTTIQETAPLSTECISYNMPAFRLNKILVYYAAFKNHIGFYALPSGNKAFQEELLKYKTGKGSIQFPLKEQIPYELIKRIVQFRLEEITTHSKHK